MLSGFDPVRREIARLSLTKLIADGRIHPARIEEVVDKAKQEVDDIVRQEGEQAAYEAGVPGLPPSSSSSSAGCSSVPATARTCSTTASRRPPGRDDGGGAGRGRGAAKIGGLLHDIGKAIDHEVEGPHAAIGGSIAQKHNIPRSRQRHRRPPPRGRVACIEAAIVQAADAISAARPGARRETMELYVKRLEDLESIANSFAGVEKSFAIQAGREVRIIVKPEEIDDLSASRLARDIARRSRRAWTTRARSRSPWSARLARWITPKSSTGNRHVTRPGAWLRRRPSGDQSTPGRTNRSTHAPAAPRRS